MATTNLQAELRPLPPATSSSLLLFAEPRGTGERSHSPANCNTNPLHTASADRRHTTLTWVERHFGFATAQAYAGHEDHGRGGKAMATYVRAGLPEVATALAALTGEDHPLAISAPNRAVPTSSAMPSPPDPSTRHIPHAED